MGRYKKEPNMMIKAAFLSQRFIKRKVWARNIKPVTITTMALILPVAPIIKGKILAGIRNNVYTMIVNAVFRSLPPFEGNNLNPAFV